VQSLTDSPSRVQTREKCEQQTVNQSTSVMGVCPHQQSH
jgi:hypothetical protein